MLRESRSLEHFAGILVGMSVAGAASAGAVAAPGVLEALAGGVGLFAHLRGQRKTDAENVLRDLTRTLEREWQSWGEFTASTDAGVLANAVASFEEVLLRCAMPPADVIGKRLDAEAIGAAILLRAEGALPEVYGDRNPQNAEAHLAREFLRKLTVRAYRHLLDQPGYMERLAPELWRAALDQLGRIEEANERIEAKLERLLLRADPQVRAARVIGVTQEALIELAQRTNAQVTDEDAAIRELQRLVELHIGVQAEGQAGSDLGDFVDAVLRRVAEQSARGAHDEATAAIDAALEQEEAESKARKVRLLDAAVEQDMLRRDPVAVAGQMVRKAALEVGEGRTLFDLLRAEFTVWYERGRDRGLNLDLEVAIALAVALRAEAQGADARGMALNDLGAALQTLGEREAGTARLEEAVAAYRAALEEYRQDRVPLHWAMTQNNLGNALRTLGAREAGTARLEEAVAAYRAALEEYRQDRVPLDWATVQNNLGNALATLGAREAGTARLEEAVAAYRAALEERRQDRVPLDWAMTQNNLGNALATLGEREAGTARLEEAVAAYRAALEERRQDRVPLDWAGTLGNEGAALCLLADRTGDVALAERALAQLRTAEAVLRDGGHAVWADYLAGLIPAAEALVARLGGADG